MLFFRMPANVLQWAETVNVGGGRSLLEKLIGGITTLMLCSGPLGKFLLTSLEMVKYGLFWQFHIPFFPLTDKDMFRPNATKRRAKDVH